MWFESLFGFAEADWQSTQAQFSLDGSNLRSRANGRSFEVGRFSTPNLAELRAGARKHGRRGDVRVSHDAIGDVLELHSRSENRGAMFQVASQLNCLEFAGPNVVPEDGVTGYAHDATQGPACSLAAAAGTVYRNYFAPVGDQIGQRADRQIDTLADLSAALGRPNQYFTVRNGYTASDAARLAALDAALAHHDRKHLLDLVRIGVQSGVGVDFSRRFVEPGTPTTVSQAFCSAISCGYVRGVSLDAWTPLATLVLDAAYEATLWAAIHDAREGAGSGKVWLTFLGGGVFGNRPEWIGGAIRRALKAVAGFDLDVHVAHYGSVNPSMRQLVDGA